MADKKDEDTKQPSSCVSRYLRPEKFEAEPNSNMAGLKWNHWLATFNNFLDSEDPHLTSDLKLRLLINHLAPTIFSIIRDCTSFEKAIELLNDAFIKPKNEIFSRHVLSSRKQLAGETISEYIQILKNLAHECNFKNVTAEEYKQEYIRDSFISGISSKIIRQRLLENRSLTLDDAIKQAVTIESAERDSIALTESTTLFQKSLRL